jgi:Protein of unknown function (DUF1552)
MSPYRIARRAFLRSCGGSLALLAPLLRGIEARAQGMPAPLRFLVIQRPCGTELDLWRPTAAATTNSFTLPANSAPFAPLQSKMAMIDGLNLVCASLNGGSGGLNTAEGGMVALMTGVPTLGQIGQQDHAAGGPSIDQLLLSRSPVLGGAGSPMGSRTPFGSLQLAADIRSDRDELAPRVLSYLPPTANPDINLARQPLFPETQPLATFNRIFGGALPVGSDSAALLAEKLSVLDYMRSDLTRLRTVIPASERVKLDTHADAIQGLEAAIRASLPPQAVCIPPPRPLMFAQTGVGATGPEAPASGVSGLSGVDYYVPGDPTSHPHQVLGRTQLEIIKAAFLCDLIRVGTFMWASGTSNVLFPTTFDGAMLPGVAPLLAAPHYEPLSVDPATTTGMATLAWAASIDRFYSDQTSQALQAFDAATDLDGNTLLDNTVVAYVNDESTRWDHGQLNMPLIVFGGTNTRIKGGTFLKVTGGSLPKQLDLKTIGGTGNRPFNDFWLALAPIFGVTLPSLGSKAQYTGPLPGFVT